jgi:gliding motility-associated-like protein
VQAGFYAFICRIRFVYLLIVKPYFVCLMRVALSILVCLLCVFDVSAQYGINQNKNWVFGHHAGIRFGVGSPSSFSSNIDAPEGCASVSDASGMLLFYTDGKKVWNRTGSLMPNGASIVSFNTGSATQSAAILPVIGDPDRYYIFSMEEAGGSGRLAYSVVDMTLAGGMGDVVTASMGTPMGTNLAEKITSIPGNCSAWILVHRRDTAKFLAYAVTTAGVSTSPVPSNIGSFSSYDSGVIKADPTGRKIVCQVYSSTGQGGTEKYDFDAITGLVANNVVLNSFNGNYGAEFSPSGAMLYVINDNAGGGSKLLQYNLVPTIPTVFTVTTAVAGPKRDLKLGPDQKIYFPAFNGNGYLDVIGAPEVVGTGCAYASSVISLAPNTCGAGMPNVYNFAGPSLITGGSKVCVGAAVTLSSPGGGGAWSSSNTGVATVSGGVVTGVATGTAVISYTLSASCYTTFTIEVVNSLSTAITGQFNLCIGNTSTLSNATTGGTWTSSNTAVATIGALSGVATGVTVGTAIITYSLGGSCLVSSLVSVNPAPVPGTITGTTNVCPFATTTLSASVSGGKWSSVNSAIAKVDSLSGVVTGVAPGIDTIKYTVGISPCSATTSVVVTVHAAPFAGDIKGPTPICNGATVEMNANVTGGEWTCSDSTKVTLTPNSSFARLVCVVKALNVGSTIISYSVGPSPQGCYGYATFELTILAVAPFVTTGHITPARCNGSNDGSIYLTFTGGNGQYLYHWSNGATGAAVGSLAAGTYTVSVEDTAVKCSRTDAYTVTQPDSFSVASTITNDKCNEGKGKITAMGVGVTGPYTYLWQNNTTAPELSGLHAGSYSVTVSDTAQCTKTAQYQLKDIICGEIVVHDVITPNGDGANETWSIDGIQYYNTNSVQVFDKWGDVVFEQNAYKNNWSGIGKGGAPVPDGTYYYLVKLNAPNITGGDEIFKGSLLIKR